MKPLHQCCQWGVPPLFWRIDLLYLICVDVRTQESLYRCIRNDPAYMVPAPGLNNNLSHRPEYNLQDLVEEVNLRSWSLVPVISSIMHQEAL